MLKCATYHVRNLFVPDSFSKIYYNDNDLNVNQIHLVKLRLTVEVALKIIPTKRWRVWVGLVVMKRNNFVKPNQSQPRFCLCEDTVQVVL